MITHALLTDMYQFTMMQGLFTQNKHRTRCVFDRFYRTNPFQGAYTVVAGLEQVIEYVKGLRFSEDDITYLRQTGVFTEEFLDYLTTFHFTGTIYAAPEGSVVFPGEVLLRVEAAKDEAILLETALSMFLNHESLIATKARRIRSVIGKDGVAEFGMRRAQGVSAAVQGARAAFIGGFDSTSDVYSAALYGMRPVGTMAHSWVMSFPTEIDAFRAYAAQYENNLVFLVDTYNTLHKGVPAAIQVFQEIRERRGGTMPSIYGIRLDSGDLAYLSIEARKMLDEAGFKEALIFATNDLDEYKIADLKQQGAAITAWGVGTKLITADETPALGGVYKLAGQGEKVLRLINARNGKLIGDLICLDHETIDTTQDYVFKNPLHPWKQTVLKANTFKVQELLVPIFVDGELVYDVPTLAQVKAYGEEQIQLLWPEFLRLRRAPEVKVNISEELHQLKSKLLLEKVGEPS